MYFDGNPMGWDGTGMNCNEMGCDVIEKYVPWTSLSISYSQALKLRSLPRVKTLLNDLSMF